MTTLNSLVVKGIRQETDLYFSIIFERPIGFEFNAGDCVDLAFTDDPLHEKKTFSFASSPTEEDLVITAKRGFSTYKDKMEKLRIGYVIAATQYGSNFVFDPNHRSLFIAGGVGVTPFRSMIKEAVDLNRQKEITLIYLSHSDNFPFIEELVKWESENPLLKVYTIATDKDGRFTKETLQKLLPKEANSVMSYVVGSPGMVDSVEEYLLELGVGKDFIRTDSFDGYVQEA